MKGPARQRGFHHFLRDQPEEEDEADVVHEERGGVRESIVAVRERVGPQQRGGAADRQSDQIVEDETRDAGRDPVSSRQSRGRVTHRRTWRGMVPESTVVPVREITWNESWLPSISTTMKLMSWSKDLAFMAERLASPFR